MNRLGKEKSPYLLQHANNPVDWYPWGEEAFAKARAEEKPIFLSIGYSTCHWCHVMEHESFENEAIAELLNRHFVAIKVDREERPDVDRIYMSAVQTMTGSGGWPLNAFLTPELKPFFGGTYFPPAPRYGQPAFPQLLQRIAQLWQERRADLRADANTLSDAVVAASDISGRSGEITPEALDNAFAHYLRSFDSEKGGFGGAPKFPMPVNLNFLLRYWARTKQADALEMVTRTLRAMAKGGIHDQVGGGFHRYATDADWFVPHFEKMLYDNAQLAVNYLEAWQATGEAEFADVARDTLDYILRDLTHKEGGFYSAEDADSLIPSPERSSGEGGRRPDEGQRKSEGAFYLWDWAELVSLVGEDTAKSFGAQPNGNITHDPQNEFGNGNLLTSPPSPSPLPQAGEDARRAGEGAKKKLLEVRSTRPRPGLDDKILASWNGLAISAFARAYRALREPKYLAAAEKAAGFLLKNLYDPQEKLLYRRWRDGERSVPGMADDYAFVAQSFLDLFEASFDPDWLERALELTERQQALFGGPAGALYQTAEGHDKNLLARVMDDHDNVEPGASSVAALNLLRLSEFKSRKDLRDAAEKTLKLFGKQLEQHPRSLPQMLVAVDFATAKPKQVVITEGSGKEVLLAELGRHFLPTAIITPPLEEVNSFFRTLEPIAGKATAYVCQNYACDLPTSDVKKFGELLAA